MSVRKSSLLLFGVMVLTATKECPMLSAKCTDFLPAESVNMALYETGAALVLITLRSHRSKALY